MFERQILSFSAIKNYRMLNFVWRDLECIRLNKCLELPSFRFDTENLDNLVEWQR